MTEERDTLKACNHSWVYWTDTFRQCSKCNTRATYTLTDSGADVEPQMTGAALRAGYKAYDEAAAIGNEPLHAAYMAIRAALRSTPNEQATAE